METFQELFELDKPLKILDVGTGRGDFISMIQAVTDNYESIIGIDSVSNSIALARESFYDDRIKFVTMDVLDMTFDDKTFDMVTLSNSLHHLSNIDESIKAMQRVVKPGGLILINEMYSDVFNQQQMSHVLMHHFCAEVDRMCGLSHNETFKRIEIIEMLEKTSDFEIDNSWDVFFGYVPPFDTESKVWLKDTIGTFLNKANGMDGYSTLKEKALKLNERIDAIGFESAPQMMVVLKNNSL